MTDFLLFKKNSHIAIKKIQENFVLGLCHVKKYKEQDYFEFCNYFRKKDHSDVLAKKRLTRRHISPS